MVLLALITAAVFSNTLHVPFVLDDHSTIRNNLSLRQLWPIESPAVGGTRGRPVVNLSFALNYLVGGASVPGYHAANLAIHVLAGLVLFGLVRRTLLLPIFADRFRSWALPLGFGAALFWLVHPLQTEAVTYLSQRTESLMGLHYLFVLYGFVRSVDSPEHPAKWRALAVLACFAGMACKEIMITAPVAVLLYDRSFMAGSFRDAWRQRHRFYFALASSWIALGGLMQGLGPRGVGFGSGVGPWSYALTESAVVVRYFKLALWPSPLVFDYGAEFAHSLAEVWPYVLVMVAGLAGVIAMLRLRPTLGFLLAWPFLTLAPTSSFVPVALQPMAEHRMYLPLAGLAVLAMLVVQRFLAARTWIGIGVIAFFLSLGAYRRNAVYADELTLWRDTVEKSPRNERARQNLGTAYLHLGRMAEAEAELARALALNPKSDEVINNLAIVYARTGRSAQAVELYEKTLALNPGFAEAHYNLGCIFLESGRTAEARRHFEETIRLNAAHSDAQINLASIFVGEGKFSEAAEHYSQALRVQPGDAELYSHRAFAHFKIGRISAAIADYEQALKLRPDLVEARRNLAILQQSLRGPAQP